MLSGGILAALAGTATVCASLAYLRPAESSSASTDSVDAAPAERRPSATAREEEGGEHRGGLVEAPDGSGRRQEEEGSRLGSYGTGLRRVVAMLTPSARNMVIFLFFIVL